MANYTFFNPQTGEIQINYSGENILGMLEALPEFSYITGHHFYETSYIQNGEAISRPTMSIFLDKPSILADGVDILTISGIPVNANIKIRKDATLLQDTVINGIETFLTNDPGEYILEVECFPYVTFKGTFNATE
jgi:hypothetical protein